MPSFLFHVRFCFCLYDCCWYLPLFPSKTKNQQDGGGSAARLQCECVCFTWSRALPVLLTLSQGWSLHQVKLSASLPLLVWQFSSLQSRFECCLFDWKKGKSYHGKVDSSINSTNNIKLSLNGISKKDSWKFAVCWWLRPVTTSFVNYGFLPLN